MKDGALTYGSYRKNAGPPRTVEQAISIYEKVTGRRMPPCVKVVVDAANPLDHDSIIGAERAKGADPSPWIALREWLHAQTFDVDPSLPVPEG